MTHPDSNGGPRGRNTLPDADRFGAQHTGPDSDVDDDAGDLVRSLIAAHGLGFSDGLRALIDGDRDATRRAVVRHLGHLPVSDRARPRDPRPGGVPADDRPGARPAAPGRDLRVAAASTLSLA